MIERVKYLCATALLLAVSALFTAGPVAASPNAVVRDCADDGSVKTGRYTRKDLREGKKRIPADLDAYSDCSAQIDAALDEPRAKIAGAGGGVPGGGGSAGTGAGPGPEDIDPVGSGSAAAAVKKPTQADEQRKRQLARENTEGLVGDRTVDPGIAGAFDKGNEAGGLSLPLLLAIVALALGLAAGCALALRLYKPELYAGSIGRIPRPRGLGPLSQRRRR